MPKPRSSVPSLAGQRGHARGFRAGASPRGSDPGRRHRLTHLAIGTWALPPLLLAAACAGGAQAADRCPGAETTRALLECLDRRLADSDRHLARTLNAVAGAARREPGGTFLPIWQTFTDEYSGGQDPGRQLRAFQRQRRQICRYAHSMSLQGSGFGVFVLSCELDLNDALLQQFRS
ncbi:MAG: hypothetical protein ACKO0M_09330 [Cyanobium sp.]